MLVVYLQGGLGNQMFQYAFARNLSLRNGRTVFLDPAPLQRCKSGGFRRPYGLHLFNVELALLDSAESERLLGQSRIVCRIREVFPGFQPKILEAKELPLTVFDGYWQSELYFSEIGELLRSEFTVRAELFPNVSLVARLESTNSVCIHVRRGDYLQQSGGHLGFVGNDYYARASRVMLERLANAHFFVFSDDINWCRAELSLSAPHTFVEYDAGGSEAAVNLCLMSRCRHFVIGNSTFAWWAAWLGSADGKIVIAPRGWFADERGARCGQKTRLSSIDLVPSTWTTV